MANTFYKVSAASLTVRSGPDLGKSAVRYISKGTTVSSYKETTASNGITWVKISSSKEEWVSKVYLSKISTAATGSSISQTTSTSSSTSYSNDSVENEDVANGASTVTGNTESDYVKLMYQMMRAFGYPPKFTAAVDPVYNSKVEVNGVGRAMSESWFTFPTIFSIAPGNVDYLPGFTSSEKDTFYNRLKASFSDDSTIASLLDKNSGDRLNGKMYEFRSSYKDYMNVVNGLVRACAVWLGIGDKVVMGTKGIKYKEMDWGYWTNLTNATTRKWNSIFAETQKALNTAISDSSYIHFILNSSGSSVREDMSVSTTSSAIEEAFNTSGISSAARNLEFLFGGAIGTTAEGDINKILSELSGSSFMSSFAKLTQNYLKGGRIVFPQMIDSVDYSRTISCTMKFVSASGDPESILLRTILPICHLLPLATPKNIAQNMYTYPYLCRVFQKGMFNTDLAVITNLRLESGGSDNMSRTANGLATEIEATFDVTPLYSNLMVTSVNNPFLFLQNTSMIEYLATMCGVDMKINNLNAKIDMAKSLVTSKFKDIPTNLARGIVDTKIANQIRNFVNVVNK